MVRVRCEDLRKEFVSGTGETIVAVDSIDIDIDDGTFVTILGPSGCGKTTLLRMLAGLETPTAGRIYYDGEDVTDWSVQDRHIGMVFQNIALFPYMTVRDNIEYGLKYTEASEEEMKQEAQAMAELLAIEDQLDDKPNQLSGGQRQRVALARALIRDPNVFLLDEPMAALDAELKVRLRTEIKELHSEFQTTTFYVTHDQEEAMTLSEEVIVINEGRIEQHSTPYKMFDAPNSKFVARFIGSPNINFFDARLENGRLVAERLAQPIDVPSATLENIQSASNPSALTLGIRPSALTLVENESDAYISGTASLDEQLGTETILHLDVGEQGTSVTERTEVRAVVPPDVIPEPGETFHFTFDRKDVHVFEEPSGEVLVNGLMTSQQEVTTRDSSVAEEYSTS